MEKSKIRMPDNYFAMWLIANKTKILIFNVSTISCINVEKRSNILYKSCGVYTKIFLEYVWSFFNIMHERVVNRSSIPWSLTANMYLEFWSSLAIQLLNTDRAGYINIYHYIATEVRQKLFPTCSFLAFFLIVIRHKRVLMITKQTNTCLKLYVKILD